jgi:hypothetical protein
MTRKAQAKVTKIERDLKSETGLESKVLPQYRDGRFVGYQVRIDHVTSDTWGDLTTAASHARHRLMLCKRMT